MNRTGSKVFGIGLSKTGTTSLARAMEILGYRTRDYMGLDEYRPGDLSCVDLTEIDANDAFTDTPIPSFYRELDAAYPGSKFILTVRDADGWLKSCRKQFTEKAAAKQNPATRQVFLDIYGTNVFDEEKFRKGYERFVAGAVEYFRDRPDDLLVLNLTAGEGWEKLCPFLGETIPDIPFPRANVTSIRWMTVDQLISAIQRAVAPMRQALATLQAHRKGALSTMQRMLFRLRGGETGLLQRARRRTEAGLVRELKALNDGIPVVLEGQPLIDDEQRRHWNHFWLVGLEASGKEGETPLASVALIEDRQPIMGVIVDLRNGTLCHASAGKPAQRTGAQGDAEALTLDQREEASHNLAGAILHGHLPIEGSRFTGTREWHTAAAQVILESSGHALVLAEGGQMLTYNKQGLENPAVALRRR